MGTKEELEAEWLANRDALEALRASFKKPPTSKLLYKLHRAGIKTLSEAADWTQGEWLREPGFGRKTLFELVEHLHAIGIMWGRQENRCIVVPEAHCAVRIDLRNRSHIIWLARRWIAGETQKQIALQIGYMGPSILNSTFEAFIRRMIPDVRLNGCYGDDRKRVLERACRIALGVDGAARA